MNKPGLSKISVQQEINKDSLLFRFSGNLDSNTTGSIWNEIISHLDKPAYKIIILELSKIEYLDGSGFAFLFACIQKSAERSILLELVGLSREQQEFLSSFKPEDFPLFDNNQDESLSQVEEVGMQIEQGLSDFKFNIRFIGECFHYIGIILKNPSRLRVREILKVVQGAGVGALVIICMIGFLLGLIMSFQSAIPMQRFGAEIFVANLVAISLFRELGPLMTAIILAGRSGSAFAAELGTMKVSEELDALTTMGLEPVEVLVIPRLIAGMLVAPILCLFFNLAGLIGSAIVILSFNYPLVTFLRQVSNSVKIKDLSGGMFKAAVFGLLVAAIGSLKGLSTKEGASAVGESTTGSVVTGIIIICVTDGIFSILFFLFKI